MLNSARVDFGKYFKNVFSMGQVLLICFRKCFQFCVLGIALYFQFYFPFFEGETSQHLQVFQVDIVGYSVIQRIGVCTQQAGRRDEHIDVSILLLHFLESGVTVDAVFSGLFQQGGNSFFDFSSCDVPV